MSRFVAHGVEWPDGGVTLRAGGTDRSYGDMRTAVAVAGGLTAVVTWMTGDCRNLPRPKFDHPLRLAPMDLAIVRCLAAGLDQAQTAKRVGVCRKTVSNKMTAVQRKVGADTPTAAVLVVVLAGLVDLNEPLDLALIAR